MQTPSRYVSIVIILVFAAFADAFLGNSTSLDVYLVLVACVSWFLGRFAGMCASLIALAVWVSVNHALSADSGYGLLSLKLSVKGVILFTTCHLVLFAKSRMGKSTDELYTDVLTNIYTMKAFREIAEREIHRCSRYRHPFSIAYLDADNFNVLNKTIGHAAGDNLLVYMAETLRSNIRKSDILACMGGDNFVLLLPETGFEHAREALIKIKSKLDDTIAERGYSITFSIGMMTYTTPPASIDPVFAACEAVMFRVKASGKNAICHEQG